MTVQRVVITGMGAITPLGSDWSVVLAKLQSGASGVRFMDEWQGIQGLDSYLAAPSTPEVGLNFPIKIARTMSRVSLIAGETASTALSMSGLDDDPNFDRSSAGIAYGSSFGAHEQMVPFGRVLSEGVVRGISPSGYIQLMGHTTGVNLSLLLGIQGRLIPASAACASGGQALGYAWETIRHGIHPVMLAGSAEELSPMQVAVFDSFYSASREHDNPATAVRPFSADRNGMVVGEGGATFILESLDHAHQRGANVLAEMVGFATNMGGTHAVRSDLDTMCRVMEMALESAGLVPEQVGYINAHASGIAGDASEAMAIQNVFGDRVPVSSTKGYTGHLLGGCGAVESWLTVNMMREGWLAPTVNKSQASSDCDGVFHVAENGQTTDCEYVMCNNFAFGGVNVSVIFKKFH